MKHQHREFPSDVFLILTTVGTKLTIGKQNEEAMISVLLLTYSWSRQSRSHLEYGGLSKIRHEWEIYQEDNLTST